MPKSKYEEIYKDLKAKIESQKYVSESLLPSENDLVQTYDCSRNTVRRAISCLNDEGYTQSSQGRGVRVIYSPNRQQEFTVTGINGLNQLAGEMGYKVRNKLITFTEITVDERLAAKSGLEAGLEVYFIQRLRYLDKTAKMVDNSVIRKDLVPGLSKEVLKHSLFGYIENTLHMPIRTVKRRITVERATPFDEKYLELGDYNCVAVITSQVYNAEGIQFEYTISRNRPDIFAFNSVVTRNMKLQ